MGQYPFYGQQAIYGQQPVNIPGLGQGQAVQHGHGQHEGVGQDALHLSPNKYALPGDDVPGGVRKV